MYALTPLAASPLPGEFLQPAAHIRSIGKAVHYKMQTAKTGPGFCGKPGPGDRFLFYFFFRLHATVQPAQFPAQGRFRLRITAITSHAAISARSA